MKVAEKANSSPEDDQDKPCDRVDSAENTDYADDGSGAGTVTVPRDGTIYLLVNIPCADQVESPGSSEGTAVPATDDTQPTT